jgi:hypothetical protein
MGYQITEYLVANEIIIAVSEVAKRRGKLGGANWFSE